MPRLFPAIFMVALLAIPTFIGCGPSASSRLVGKWELDTTKSIDDATAGKNQPGSAIVAGLMKEMAKAIKVEVEFKPGGVMSVTAPTMLAKTETKSGAWKVSNASGNDVTILRKLDGESAEQEIKVKFVDNDTLEMVPPASNAPKTPATFRRVK